MSLSHTQASRHCANAPLLLGRGLQSLVFQETVEVLEPKAIYSQPTVCWSRCMQEEHRRSPSFGRSSVTKATTLNLDTGKLLFGR